MLNLAILIFRRREKVYRVRFWTFLGQLLPGKGLLEIRLIKLGLGRKARKGLLGTRKSRLGPFRLLRIKLLGKHLLGKEGASW